MNSIIIKGEEFKQYLNTKYYCDKNGNIYSGFSHKILKPMKRNINNKSYYYIDINFGEGQKHILIHKIVYETWIGSIPKGLQINHKDDNSYNNFYLNLYAGNQKENIQDCISNQKRVGNTWILTVFDKKENETITFCPAKDFIKYSGHPCANGCVQRMFSRNWFKKRYNIIDYYLCLNNDIKKSVTTIPDECKGVELNEAYCITNSNEEIV